MIRVLPGRQEPCAHYLMLVWNHQPSLPLPFASQASGSWGLARSPLWFCQGVVGIWREAFDGLNCHSYSGSSPCLSTWGSRYWYTVTLLCVPNEIPNQTGLVGKGMAVWLCSQLGQEPPGTQVWYGVIFPPFPLRPLCTFAHSFSLRRNSWSLLCHIEDGFWFYSLEWSCSAYLLLHGMFEHLLLYPWS